MVAHSALHDLTWCLAPELALRETWRIAPLKTRLYRLREFTKIGGVIDDESDVAFFTTSNQLLNLAPLFDQHRPRAFTSKILRLPHDWRQAAAALRRAPARLNAPLEGRHQVMHWTKLIASTAKNLIEAQRYFESRRPKRLFVSTQHDARVRAWIRAAKHLGIPSIYIPHAPVARNDFYHDLPVNIAALRGAAEAHYYETQLGIWDERLLVVGDLSSPKHLESSDRLNSDRPGVLALSPNSSVELSQVISLVRDAAPARLIVAPHPRSDVAELQQLLPSNWELLHGVRTIEHLSRGAAYVLQHSSGVALEAVSLGIPTADIRLPGKMPNYPFLDDHDLITPVSSAAELRTFIADAERGVFTRTIIRERSARWRMTVAEPVGKTVRETVAAVGPGEEAIFDGWEQRVNDILKVLA